MSKQLRFKSWVLLAVMLFGVSSAWAVEVTDVLNQAFTNITTSYYQTFSGQAPSEAIFVGQCAGNNESIQLRSTNNDSGIVTTKSGGKFKKIVVEWHGNTPSGNALNVYGSHTAYTDETDLYDSKKQGQLIGTIVKGKSTELELTNEYEYIGLRSANGVMYLKEIRITWETTTISASTLSLTGFTYNVYSGPSAAQPFTVSGKNLTEGITVSVGESSNFELALNEIDEYSNSLTINQSEGTVESTTVYVRMKAGLRVNSYTGTITMTSAGASESSVSLSGSVTPLEQYKVTWDLSKKQTATASPTQMTWTSANASMVLDKGSSTTNANAWYPGVNKTNTRFYPNQILTIAPAYDYEITCVVFEATAETYASNLQGSTWKNAAATVSGKTVTVIPIDGSSAISAIIGEVCGFTSVKVYYEQVRTVRATITSAGYATYCSPYAIDFYGTGLTAYIATLSGSIVSFSEVPQVPARTGVLLKGAEGTYQIPVLVDSSISVLNNKLVGVTEEVVVDGSGIFVLMNGSEGVGFYKTTAPNFTVGAHTAFIRALEENSSRNFIAIGETTAIKAIESKQQSGEIYNLAGQRVKSAQKDLYIIDGKKVIK